MSPSEFMIRLQRGITGGFAPPTPSAIYTISKGPDSEVTITSSVREDGQPMLGNPTEKTITSTQVNDLVNELETILKEIPVEYPSGSEDIYSLDTGIFWGSTDFEWMNGGPGGCGGGSSEAQPTPGQKESFKRAVKIIEEMVELE
ncbi:Ff.00g011470.m01.CDS01 [Fusarium sp. VM40]|nr:Ff.00g011470.m01.CDS01 [Fusarium sp. VM40]